jgi:hypothetical protein
MKQYQAGKLSGNKRTGHWGQTGFRKSTLWGIMSALWACGSSNKATRQSISGIIDRDQ